MGRRSVRRLAGSLALVSLTATACSSPMRSGRGSRPAADVAPTADATGVVVIEGAGHARLGYASALCGSRWLSAELGTRFELVARPVEGPRKPAWRTDIGSADYDVTALSCAPGQKRVWLASRDGSVRGYDLETGKLSVTWRLGAAATAVSARADWVATGTDTGVLCLRRAHDGALLQCVAAHDGAVSDLSSTDDVLVSGGHDGAVSAWRLPSLAVVHHTRRRGAITAVAIDRGATTIAFARSPSPPQRTPELVARERRGDFTVAGSHRVERWQLASNRSAAIAYTTPISAIAFVRGTVVIAAWDRHLTLWSASGEIVARLGPFPHLVSDVAIGDGARWAAVSTWISDLPSSGSWLLGMLYSQ